MEEKETGEREPVDLRCAEQAELLSLIISGEEEATQEESDLGGKGKKKLVLLLWCFPPQSGSAWLSEPRPLSSSQLLRVTDNAIEQHGPSCLCGSYKQRLNSTQAGGLRHKAATQWTAAAQAVLYQRINNHIMVCWFKWVISCNKLHEKPLTCKVKTLVFALEQRKLRAKFRK